MDIESETKELLEKLSSQNPKEDDLGFDKSIMFDEATLAKEVSAIMEEEQQATKIDDLDSLATEKKSNNNPIDMSIPSEVKRCTDDFILSALKITKKDYSNYHFSDLVDDIMFINPRVKIENANKNMKDTYSKIYIDCDLKDLVLPEPFYFDNYGIITNKKYAIKMGGYTLNCEVGSLNELYKEINDNNKHIRCDKEYDIEEFAKVVKELNNDEAIIIDDEKNKIYSDIELEKIKLPQGFYYNSENKITNKGNSINGIYITLDWQPIEKCYALHGKPETADLTKKSQNHNTTKSLIFSKIQKKVVEVWQKAINKIKNWWDKCKWRKKNKKQIDEIETSLQEKSSVEEWDPIVAEAKDLLRKVEEKIATKTDDIITETEENQETALMVIESKIKESLKETAKNISVPLLEVKDNQNTVPTLEKSVVLTELAEELEDLNNRFNAELEKGIAADIEYLEQINKRIEKLNKEAKIEREKIFGRKETEQPIIDETTPQKDESVEKEHVEPINNNEPRILIEDKKSKLIGQYAGYSANALENVYKSLEAILISGRVVVREKKGKFIINDKNLLLKYQMACIWKSVNDKLGRDPFTKEAKFEFNYMLSNCVNSLSAGDYVDTDLVLANMSENNFADKMKATYTILTNQNSWSIMDKFCKQAESAPVADIDKCKIVDNGLNSNPEKIQKTQTSSFGRAKTNNVKIAESLSQDALIKQILDESNKTTKDFLEGKIDKETYRDLIKTYTEKIAVLKGEKNITK